MDTIRELFYGNIHPFERDVCPLLNLYILLISKCMFLRLFSCFLAFDISHFNGFCSIFGDLELFSSYYITRVMLFIL